jgi:hypothetical protein
MKNKKKIKFNKFQILKVLKYNIQFKLYFVYLLKNKIYDIYII